MKFFMITMSCFLLASAAKADNGMGLAIQAVVGGSEFNYIARGEAQNGLPILAAVTQDKPVCAICMSYKLTFADQLFRSTKTEDKTLIACVGANDDPHKRNVIVYLPESKDMPCGN